MILPDSPRSSRWWRLALAGQLFLVFGAVALSSPGRIDIVDGQTRYEVARSLVEHGDAVIRDPNVWLHVYPGRDGDLYSDYRFPQSVLAVAAIGVADVSGPISELRRQFFFTFTPAFAAACLALAYAVFFRWRGLSPTASLAWAALGIFCTPSWYYGTSAFDDILGTAGLVSALTMAFVTRERWPLLGAMLTGLLLAWVVNCKQPLGVFTLPVLVAGHSFGLTRRRQCLRVGLVLGGLLCGMIAYKAYDLYKFPPGSLDGSSLEAVWTSNPLPGLASLALSPACCVFLYCPTLVLSIAGWRQWRREDPWLCGSVLLASAVFTLFICFILFFKGDPAWGPRYLTPVFAVWWLFVPAARASLSFPMVKKLLAAGCVVQVLALSVDPQRLFLEQGCPFGYYTVAPWLGFNPALSHLLRRPGEIAAIVSSHGEPAGAYSPAPFATYATTIPSLAPDDIASAVGLMALPEATQPFATPPAILRMREATQASVHFPQAARTYHVFASWRPWWLSQAYLMPEERPVDLGRAASLLVGLSALGLGLMVVGVRRCRDGEIVGATLAPAAL